MKTQHKLALVLFLLLSCLGQAYGQIFDDWEGRPSISIKHKFNNGIGFRARYSHYLDHNLSHYKKSALGIKIDYKIRVKTWLNPAVDYRYKYNGRESTHDIRYYAKISHEVGNKFELKYYPKFQHKIAHNKAPEFYFRNKIEFVYKVINPLKYTYIIE